MPMVLRNLSYMSESLMLAVIQVVKVLEKPSLSVMCLMVDIMAMVC
jgi:hypothetical protein